MIVCLYSLPYLSNKHSACSVLYCHLWSVTLYHIFPHYPTNDTIFDEEMSIRLCFDFLYSLA